jgi:hypothetical protein
MITTEEQVTTLPLRWTHATPESFKKMWNSWVKAWKKSEILTPSEREVLDALAFKVSEEFGVAFPSQVWLEKNVKIPVEYANDRKTGKPKVTKTRPVKNVKTIKRAIKRLEGLGAITILKGSDRIHLKRGRVNEYLVRFDRGPTGESTAGFLRLLKPVDGYQDLPNVPMDVPMDVPILTAKCPPDTFFKSLESLEAFGVVLSTREPGGEAAGLESTNEEKKSRGATDIPPAVGGSSAGADSPKSSAPGSQPRAQRGTRVVHRRNAKPAAPKSSAPESPAVASGGNALGRRSRGRSRTLNPDSAMGLAKTFQEALRASEGSSERFVDFKGLKPLAGKISGWLKAGKSPDTIRKMIELYTSNIEGYRSRNLPVGTAAWLDFAGRANLLFQEARRIEKAAEDADYWASGGWGDPASNPGRQKLADKWAAMIAKQEDSWGRLDAEQRREDFEGSYRAPRTGDASDFV